MVAMVLLVFQEDGELRLVTKDMYFKVPGVLIFRVLLEPLVLLAVLEYLEKM